jgi:putative two-component system response regulator
MMPEMNGYEVCKTLKADVATQKIPVIFVTALLNPGDETMGFEAGGVDYITKPVIAALISVRIKAHLALKKVQAEMDEWNGNLKKRLLNSFKIINIKNEALISAEEFGLVLTLELLSGVFELMEDRFGSHARAIGELAGDAAHTLNLSAEKVARIRLAGLLHDVGTLGYRRGSSDKHEADMTADEREKFYAHPALGQDLFKSHEELQDVGLMVRGHHEAYDGSGFPDGAKGDDIPLGARLIAIAAFIDHAASTVCENRGEHALISAREHCGTLFDPLLLTCFTSTTRIHYEGGLYHL